mmetsp:Transcript_99329/g.289881  ORF Transcript_99329/g.289881 Transcript_99329/m.289881 type:complete len:245 (+) Transcript_99329:137-871(+)
MSSLQHICPYRADSQYPKLCQRCHDDARYLRRQRAEPVELLAALHALGVAALLAHGADHGVLDVRIVERHLRLREQLRRHTLVECGLEPVPGDLDAEVRRGLDVAKDPQLRRQRVVGGRPCFQKVLLVRPDQVLVDVEVGTVCFQASSPVLHAPLDPREPPPVHAVPHLDLRHAEDHQVGVVHAPERDRHGREVQSLQPLDVHAGGRIRPAVCVVVATSQRTVASFLSVIDVTGKHCQILGDVH